MNPKFYSGIIFLTSILWPGDKANAQSWLWAKGMGGTDYDAGVCIVIDPSNGDVYTTGYFYGEVDFDPGPGTFNLFGNVAGCTFVSKLDSSGNFVWAKAISTHGFTNSIVFDSTGAGAVLITGSTPGGADFDPGEGIYYLHEPGIFICKLDNSGNFVWAKEFGGSNTDSGQSIVLDFSGNIYTTGRFHGTGDFDPGPDTFNITTFGYWDIFVSKLDSAGNFIWAKAMGGESYYGQPDEVGYDIDVDAAGNVYTTGYFYGAGDFDPGAGIFNLTSVGNADIFISKLDSSGNFIWAKAIGGHDSDFAMSIAVDPGNGDVYTTGDYNGSNGGVDFDPGPQTFYLTASYIAMFISKLDSSGSFVWAKAIPTGPYGGGNCIAFDLSGGGGVYTTGGFYGTVDFNPGVGTYNLIGPGMFISKLNSSGDFVWAVKSDGQELGFGLSLVLGPQNKVLVTGDFGDAGGPLIQFNCITLPNHENICYIWDGGYIIGEFPCYITSDIFIVKLDGNAPLFNCVVTNTNDIGAGSLRDIISGSSNGGTITFSLPPSSQITLTSGEILINKDLTLSGPGIPDLTISGNNTSRIFNLFSGNNLILEDLSLKNATAVTHGGAIYVKGNLTLENVLLENNFENGSPKGLTLVGPGKVTIMGNVDIQN